MLMRAFARDRRGGVAVIFAVTLLPVLAAAGAAVDYSRLLDARQKMHREGDQLALAAAASGNTAQAASAVESARKGLLARTPGIRTVSVEGTWLDPSHYRVSVGATLDMTIVSALPGMPDTVRLGVVSIAQVMPPVLRVLPPRLSMLEPEAGDYNRIYIYCFDPLWAEKNPNDPNKGRRDFVPLSDNASPPTDFEKEYKKEKKEYKLPACVGGEVPSYMLRNVRNARTRPALWDTDRDYYEYFTDTKMDRHTKVMTINYVGEYIDNQRRRTPEDLTNRPMLETILCDSEKECRTTDQGGILPTRRTNRNPATATGACAPGKLMYYGYEDRPGGDRDYDDIRLVISCPEVVEDQAKNVRLVR